uniref:Uncharacterized protein n=2 Tax=Clytia hemisphaerica TaxID=252671 RepID=A0A7M5VBJ6_9CNID
MADSTQNLADEQTSARVGSHGKFKMNKLYIEDPAKRKKKEDEKIGQLHRLVVQISELTKMPVAVLALSGGNIVVSGSTNTLYTEFLQDPEVKQKFEKCAKADSEPLPKSNCEEVISQNITEKRRKIKIKPEPLPRDWECLNCLDKRVIVTDIVKWYFNIEIPWRQPQPDWWPNELPFKSPRKSSVHVLDKIIKAFLKRQAFDVMEMLSREDSNNDWESLTCWTENNGSALDFPVDWINRHFPHPNLSESTLDSKLVSLKYRSMVQTFGNFEPMKCESIAECVSYALFGNAKIYAKFFKLCGLIFCVQKTTKLLQY